jgi:hypothetical protein
MTGGLEPHERWQCPTWLLNEDGRIIGRCLEHFAGVNAAAAVLEAAAVRGLLIERSWSPGSWPVEDVLGQAGIDAHDNTIGGTVAQLAAEGLIIRVGAVNSKRPSRHGASVALWTGARWMPGQAALPGVDARRRGRPADVT